MESTEQIGLAKQMRQPKTQASSGHRSASRDSYDFVLGTTIFLGAFLLFQVQLIMGKYILPWFGGTPSVWTSCMLVFQILLLAGYCYAHLISGFTQEIPGLVAFRIVA